VSTLTVEGALERYRTDFRAYSEDFLQIVNKDRQIVPFLLNSGQIAFEEAIHERQVSKGLPIRAIILKARQIGFSSLTQGRMIRDTTLNGNRRGLVVAHELDAAGKLFQIGQGMYARLPEDRNIKPPTRYVTRGRHIHFAPPERDAWMHGDLWPDSTYQVDTANEAEGGRASTYDYLHLSEVGFWANAIEKLTALMQTVPQRPHTWVIIESTANGANLFKDEWDRAVAGRSEYLPFFWPWWKEPTYSLPFANRAEKAAFRIGRGEYSDGERELVDPGPPDPLTGEPVVLNKEQLHWRRFTIRNQTLGRIEKFHQEYPSTAQEAFIASGRQRFDARVVSQILVKCDVTDPEPPSDERPGPIVGGFRPGGHDVREGRVDTVRVPKAPVWVPDDEWYQDPWRLWLPRDEEGMPKLEPVQRKDLKGRPFDMERQFILGADVSGGLMDEGATDTDWHAIQIIDHRTREQVAEYRSHIDPDLLAEQVLLAALFFNRAFVAVEVTGGWGLPVVRKVHFDYHYPRVYLREILDQRNERETDRLGWSTDRRTKPIIESNLEELLREGTHGIKSRQLCLEMLTFVRDDRGRTSAEPGKHDDLVVAEMIAQQVADETPIRPDWWGKRPATPYTPRNAVTGY
jgi:hypothetical protein